jgi:hypothetical protein
MSTNCSHRGEVLSGSFVSNVVKSLLPGAAQSYRSRKKLAVLL